MFFEGFLAIMAIMPGGWGSRYRRGLDNTAAPDQERDR